MTDGACGATIALMGMADACDIWDTLARLPTDWRVGESGIGGGGCVNCERADFADRVESSDARFETVREGGRGVLGWSGATMMGVLEREGVDGGGPDTRGRFR